MYGDSAGGGGAGGGGGVTDDDDDEEDYYPETCCDMLFTADGIYWTCEQPLKCLFTYSVMDVEKTDSEKDSENGDEEVNERIGVCATVQSFVFSVVWIAALSAVMVQGATKIGCLCSINASLMGLVVLAAGTSVPDCLASVAVAKEGKGDMAVSNAIGSNVFDILLGLGLPWYLAIDVVPRYNGLQPEPMILLDEGKVTLVFAGLQLIFILAIVMMALVCNGWVLSSRIGSYLFSLYFLFVVLNFCVDVKIIPLDPTLWGLLAN
jgi:Ca2+/Na+ antiporter